MRVVQKNTKFLKQTKKFPNGVLWLIFNLIWVIKMKTINKWKEGARIKYGINYRFNDDDSAFEIGIKIPLLIYHKNDYHDFETNSFLSCKVVLMILFYIRRRSNKFINKYCLPEESVFWYEMFWEKLKYKWIFDCNVCIRKAENFAIKEKRKVMV